MLERKHLIVLLLFVLAGILFFARESTLQDKMLDALNSHEHETALILASTLLQKEPGNQEAIKVIKESGQILKYLQLAQSKLSDFSLVKDQNTGQFIFYQNSAPSSSDNLDNVADKVIVNAEKVYENFSNARAYVTKAKQLDSSFNKTLNFDKSLDEAQAFVLNILATNVVNVGNNVYSNVYKNYQNKEAIMNSAAGFDYFDKLLSVQSAWAPMEISTDKFKNDISPLLKKMESTGQLVSGYKSGKAETLSNSLLNYIQVVRKTVDVLVLPKGSYQDFRKVANDSTVDYKKAQSKLMRALPGSANVNNFSKLVESIITYELFQNDSIVELIKDNQYIQGA